MSKMMKTCDVLRFLSETNFNMADVSHENCAVYGKKHLQKHVFNFLCITVVKNFNKFVYSDRQFYRL